MIQTKEEVELFLPNPYAVILLNDDTTTMDFVVEILESIFHKNKDEAINLMFEIHESGWAVCGNYTLDVALSKKRDVLLAARSADFPLQCEIKEV